MARRIAEEAGNLLASPSDVKPQPPGPSGASPRRLPAWMRSSSRRWVRRRVSEAISLPDHDPHPEVGPGPPAEVPGRVLPFGHDEPRQAPTSRGRAPRGRPAEEQPPSPLHPEQRQHHRYGRPPRHAGGELLLPPCPPRRAPRASGQRAQRGPARPADARPQLHEGLVQVARAGPRSSSARRQRLQVRASPRVTVTVAVDEEEAREHPGHVAVHRRRRDGEGDAGHRTRGVGAEARERAQPLQRGGEPAVPAPARPARRRRRFRQRA